MNAQSRPRHRSNLSSMSTPSTNRKIITPLTRGHVSQIEPPQNRRVNLRAIIFKNGKLFCQKLKASHTLHDSEFWCTPGGGIEFGESLHEGLTREIIEETGVKPVIGNLLFIQQFMDGEREQLEFFFHVTNADDYDTLDLANTSHGDIEVAECGFVDPKTTVIKPDFLMTIDLEDAISSSSPIRIAYDGRL